MNIKDIIWTEATYQEFTNYLISIKDSKYQEFNSKIINTKYPMLGIKIPYLRKIANLISKGNYPLFLNIPNTYYELVLLKGLIISNIKDLKELELYFYNYLDLIDNWALCDTFCSSLKIVNQNKSYFYNLILSLVKSPKEYYVRVGLVLLLNYYVEEPFLPKIFNIVDNLNTNVYYINMAEAWLVSECFIKYPHLTFKYLEHNNLNKFTINKSISKIKDSKRITKSMKAKLNKFKK